MAFNKVSVLKTVEVTRAVCDICGLQVTGSNPAFTLKGAAFPYNDGNEYRTVDVRNVTDLGFRFGNVEHICLECLRSTWNLRSPEAPVKGKYLGVKIPVDTLEIQAEAKFTKGELDETAANLFVANERAKVRVIDASPEPGIDANGSPI